MKNKKLLTALCLFALTGCQFTTPSTSTGGNTSSPAPSVPNTSDTSDTSSPEEEQISVVEAKINALKAKAENGVNAPLKSAVKVQEYSSNANQNILSTYFYKDAIYTTEERIMSYGEYGSGTYRTILDGRYYELSISDIYDVEYARYNLSGNKIVAENANALYNEINEADAKAYITDYSPALVDAFAMGTTLKSLSTAAFAEYDEENCYDITFEEQYANANVNGTERTKITYTKYTSDDLGRKNLYTYACEYTFDNNGYVTGLAFTQSQYDYEEWDADKCTIKEGAEPTDSYYNTYTFTYGEVVAEETPMYNIADYAYTDFDLEFYKEFRMDWSTGDGTPIFNSPLAEGEPVENLSTIYAKVTSTPASLESDSLYISGLSKEGAASVYFNSYGYAEITLKGSGETTMTVSTTLGTEKSYTFTVFSPDPTGISCYEDLPSTSVVGQVITLPECDVEPFNADQVYEWSVVEGNATVSYNEETGNYELVANEVGSVTVRATVPGTEYYVELSTNVIQPLTETELRAKIINTAWIVEHWSGIFELVINEDGTGYVDFGFDSYYDYNTDEQIVNTEKTTYNFNWTLDYANGKLELTNTEWVNVGESSNFTRYDAPTSIDVDLVGRYMDITFHIDYGWGDPTPDLYSFTPAPSFDEVKVNFVDSTFQCSLTVEYGVYVDLYIILNSDGTGSIYTIEYDYSSWPFTETVITFAEFTWAWDGENIVLDKDIVINTTVEAYDQNYDSYYKDVTVTIDKTFFELDKFFAKTFHFNYTYEGSTAKSVFTLY